MGARTLIALLIEVFEKDVKGQDVKPKASPVVCLWWSLQGLTESAWLCVPA